MTVNDALEDLVDDDPENNGRQTNRARTAENSIDFAQTRPKMLYKPRDTYMGASIEGCGKFS